MLFPFFNSLDSMLNPSFWSNGDFLSVKKLDPRETTPEFRLFVVELNQKCNAQKTKPASAFFMSQQTMDNRIESYNLYRLSGLINSTKNQGNTNRTKDNKARLSEAAKRVEKLNCPDTQMSLDNSLMPEPQVLEELEQTSNRYAVVTAIFILLVSEFKWFNWLTAFYCIFIFQCSFRMDDVIH